MDKEKVFIRLNFLASLYPRALKIHFGHHLLCLGGRQAKERGSHGMLHSSFERDSTDCKSHYSLVCKWTLR